MKHGGRKINLLYLAINITDVTSFETIRSCTKRDLCAMLHLTMIKIYLMKINYNNHPYDIELLKLERLNPLFSHKILKTK